MTFGEQNNNEIIYTVTSSPVKNDKGLYSTSYYNQSRKSKLHSVEKCLKLQPLGEGNNLICIYQF